jgi:ketosteroid isomerase-like protein
MKVKLAIALILIVPVCALGQSALQEMVKTEQAFSKMAEEKSTRDAFLAFIADDGLLFRPGAVNGKKWLLEHPAPPTDKKPLLAWQPSFAGMSASGDMGFTTGPWEFKADVKDEKPAGYGHFVTVWKKQADGTWKFVVDLGVSHPMSGGPQTLWKPADSGETSFKEVNPAKALQALLDRDRSYATGKFSDYASPDVRLYRPGNLPYIGMKAASEALAKAPQQITWQLIGGDVAHAGDLGYTHGTFDVQNDTNVVKEHGSYVRIWKRENGAWRIVMDVINLH